MGKNIETLIANGNLQDAIKEFGQFLEDCEEQRNLYAQTKARFIQLDGQIKAGTLDNTDNLELNRIRLSFLEQVDKFNHEVLWSYFTMADREKVYEGFTSRDKIIHEVLNFRLLPKRYILKEKLIEGNSSIVYRLQNVDTTRYAVAQVLKIPELTDEMKTEIRQLSDLRHRNVIKLLDNTLDAFPAFIITEYVHGTTLPEAIEKTGPRPAAQAVDWLYQLTEALDYLRHNRVLHTNMRPSKIFIDDEWQIMISPFDLLKATTGEHSFNRFLDVCKYGSPELLENDGKPLSLVDMCVSDQYSLGLLAYKILTGNDLFEGETILDILESRKKFKSPAHRRALFSKLPKDSFDIKIAGSKNLVGIIQQLLSEDKTKRFQSLHQLLRALHPFTRADIAMNSLARQSYRRCMAVNKNFIKDFYQHFTRKHTTAQKDFSDLGKKRQSAMLQMAIDILLDIDEKQELFQKIAGGTQHGGYQPIDFEFFMDTLVLTLKENDALWNDAIAAEWAVIKEKTIALIHAR